MNQILKYLFLVVFILNTGHISAQLSNQKIEELSATEARRYANVLSLSLTKELALSKIIAEYDRLISSSILDPESYIANSKKYKTKKESDIEQLLGDRGYRNYKLFKEIDRSSAEEYYQDISGAISEDKVLLTELSKYFLDNVFPVLSNYRAMLDTNISNADRREINLIKSSIYRNIEIDIDRDSLIFLDTISNKLYYDLLAFTNKYDEEYNQIMVKLEPYTSQWKQAIGNMLEEQYSDSQLKSISEANENLAKRGVLTSIDRLSFFLLEPGDKNKFFKNIKLITLMKEYMMYNK